MKVEKKILMEIERYSKITKYLNEQETEVVPEPAEDKPDLGGDENVDMAADAAASDLGGVTSDPEPVDVDSDPDVEVVGEPDTGTGDAEGGTEELDITDLVTTQKDMSEKQEEYMDTMISKLDDLTSRLADMDQILQKINDLENKVEKYRQKTPEEKLQLRSLDSYPYNQKLTDFFMDKEEEFEKTGKEYSLRPEDVENYSKGEIKKSFDLPISGEEKW